MKKAILKIIVGLLLIVGGIYGVHLFTEGVVEFGNLDQYQLP